MSNFFFPKEITLKNWQKYVTESPQTYQQITFLEFLTPQTLCALKNFPELKNTRICFCEKKINSTMNCRPNIWSLFRKRTYVVGINTTNKKFPQINDLSFNAQVGIIAHELSHVIDYESKNFWKIITFGWQYLRKKQRTIIEQKIDHETIRRGYGHQLLDWAQHSELMQKTNKFYQQKKQNIYLSAAQIKKYISK